MKFEHLLTETDGFGRFQITVICIIFVARFTLPCHFLVHNFIAAVPAHRCDISGLDDGDVFENLTQDQRLKVSIPAEEDGTLSSCKMFAEPQLHLLHNSSSPADVSVVPCQNGWAYDTSTFTSTLATEWDLVCDKKSMSKATATIFFTGVMIGAMVFGSLSDRFGRKSMLMVSYVSGMIFGVASAFSTSFVMFAVMRFFTGFGITGISIISTVLSVEWVDIEHRKLVGVIDSLAWTFGNVMLAGIAYFVTDWRWLIVAITSPLVLAILSWRWLPESARWLIANGKVDKAHYYLRQCAKMNKKEGFAAKIKPETLSTVVFLDKGPKTYTYLDLVRTPKMRKLALLTGIIWYGIASTYYGISFNITGFGLNIYLTQFTYGLIELPAKLSVYYLLDRIGRRRTEMGALLLAGVCLGINIFVPKDMWLFRSIIAILGKGGSSASFTTVFLYTSELYPTVVRQNGLGYNSFMARLGVSIAPLIILLDDVWKPLPQVIMCTVAITSGLVASLLPETKDKRLPETIEDIEQTRYITRRLV
ncbi:solute carrier family 22 member 7 [Megalops cyprinoides]|uniref:solute carrier family 22 member 7 n=1 Tax=Megalops cyprinoides TaxID=118141 RepID=UPI001864475A|nr:solute carrier family 22 member 7 [Megalops cyprinoides]